MVKTKQFKKVIALLFCGVGGLLSSSLGFITTSCSVKPTQQTETVTINGESELNINEGNTGSTTYTAVDTLNKELS
jgi:hypothetical protein